MIEPSTSTHSAKPVAFRGNPALAWASVVATGVAVPVLFIEVFGMSFLGIEKSLAPVVATILMGQVVVSAGGLILCSGSVGGRVSTIICVVLLALALPVLGGEFWAIAQATGGWPLIAGLTVCLTGTTLTLIQITLVLRSPTWLRVEDGARRSVITNSKAQSP